MRKLTLLVAAAALVALASAGSASAATTCTFTTAGTTMTLNSSCTTDSTISVPNGFTLDGAGNTITAVDPAGDHFKGAVVANGGSSANVTNLGVTASGLADVCDGGADRLRGIMLDGASGSITNNTVNDLNQGASGCQEGNAIDVRNAPFDGTHPGTKSVVVSGNTVARYQKGGVIANGDVTVQITDNSVTGLGPVNYIAQNGIQIGFGGTGLIRGNTVTGNDYTPKDTVSCGILLIDANGVRAAENRISKNEANMCNVSKGGGNTSSG